MLKYLVFSGGGIRGLAFLGAVRACQENMIIEGCAGTSAGAILSLLVVLGFSYADMLYELEHNVCLSGLVNYNWMQVLTSYGFDKGEKLEKELERLLIVKKFDPNITLRELFYKTHKLFSVVATNIDTQKSVIFDHIHFPELSVVKAVRMSAALPGIFCPIKYQNKVYVDGSISNHFPINIFPEDQQIGFLLEKKEKKNVLIGNIFEYIITIVNIMMKHMNTTITKNTIILPCDLEMTDFNCNINAIKNNIKPAYESTLMWFNKDSVPCI